MKCNQNYLWWEGVAWNHETISEKWFLFHRANLTDHGANASWFLLILSTDVFILYGEQQFTCDFL